jgi:hypothetical protein
MLFMLNNPIGSNDLVSALGQDRLQLGFPGGGTLDGHIVRYTLISQQPTSLGELNGGVTRLRDANVARDFRLGKDATNAEDGAADDEVSCP